MLNKLSSLKELLSFFWKRKLWWLVPMLLIFLIFAILILFVGSSPLAPVVYPLF